MSYLDSPRLHFNGWFQADVSTINNDIRFYQNLSFVPEYQGLNQNGSWNPEGTGIFRLLDCTITGGFLDGQLVPVTGITIENAKQRAPGKLVDLDPQQQLVSQIWGMGVRLVEVSGQQLLESEFTPAAFINLWFRQQTGVTRDQQMAACYQSVLENVRWSDSNSALLNALRAATQDDRLSIEFNVYGYGRDNSIPRYTMGHLIGTIGPYLRGEPKFFTRGRQMIAKFTNPKNPFLSDTNFGNIQAKAAADFSSVTVDFGNGFPLVAADGPFVDIGPVSLGVLKTSPDTVQSTVTPDQVTVIGQVPYLDPGWYTQTAGVVTFDLSENSDAQKLLPSHPLVVLTPSTAAPPALSVLIQESVGGYYLRSDNYVYRFDPGETKTVEFYADRFGAPIPNAVINLAQTDGFMGGSGGGPTISPPARPVAAIPNINQPANVIPFPATVTANDQGYASIPLTASKDGPGRPRGYLGGQVYGIGYQLAAQPPGYVPNNLNYISILAFDKKDVPEQPTWYRDIQQPFTQYGNLYPIMGRHIVNLADYLAVCRHLKILRLAFDLPIEDPNHMPVTRDLGIGDRNTILKWIETIEPDGLPRLGTPEQSPEADAPAFVDPVAAESMVALLPEQAAGKTAVILQYQARQNAKEHQK
jgi:hypothetical protein